MGYWITMFGSTSLTTVKASQDTGLGPAALGLVALPGGGVYDTSGTGAANIQLPYRLVASGELLATALGDMRTALYALRALVGTRATLYRTPDGGVLNSETALARLERVSVRREAENVLILPVSMEFQIMQHPWAGGDATKAAKFTGSPLNVVCANGGNATVTNAVITITAAGTNITNVIVLIVGVCSFEWTGTLVVGNDLVIDCGRKTVTNNAVDAYSGFELGAGHTVSDWLRLPAGNTTVVLAKTGGSADTDYEIAFSDGWA